jgi:hypothetical protein
VEVDTRSAGDGGDSGRSGRPNFSQSLALFPSYNYSSPLFLSPFLLGYRTYFACNYPDFLPHESRQYILQKRQVDVCFLDFEFCIAGVQGEGERVCFAGFDGAGEEVEGEELHLGSQRSPRADSGMLWV